MKPPFAELIADNNPNHVWGKHAIEVTLKQWKYEATFTTKVGGNCHGLELFDSAISNIYDELPKSDGLVSVTLRNAKGEELLCQDEEADGEEWLRKMVVSCRIIGFEPPTLNEIRKSNGAPPVEGGDKPHVALGSS